jgi:hypothetical protein
METAPVPAPLQSCEHVIFEATDATSTARVLVAATNSLLAEVEATAAPKADLLIGGLQAS